MSDMEQSDVVDAAPEALAAVVQNDAAPAPAEAPAEAPAPEAAPAEPTAEELQAEIDALKAQIDADAAEEVPAPEPVPVVAQQPSSAAASQQPQAAPESLGWDKPLSLEDAARVLLILVKAHRTAGDSDVEAAIADVEAALPPAAA